MGRRWPAARSVDRLPSARSTEIRVRGNDPPRPSLASRTDPMREALTALLEPKELELEPVVGFGASRSWDADTLVARHPEEEEDEEFEDDEEEDDDEEFEDEDEGFDDLDEDDDDFEDEDDDEMDEDDLSDLEEIDIDEEDDDEDDDLDDDLDELDDEDADDEDL